MDHRLVTNAGHPGDYISPNMAHLFQDFAFPNLAHGEPGGAPWGSIELGLAEGMSHEWYCHSSLVKCGYANRDEVILMYNVAKAFAHGAGLEVGCYFGWTTAHLALPFRRYDVIDPILGLPERSEVESSLRAAGVLASCRLLYGSSPATSSRPCPTASIPC